MKCGHWGWGLDVEKIFLPVPARRRVFHLASLYRGSGLKKLAACPLSIDNTQESSVPIEIVADFTRAVEWAASRPSSLWT